MSDENNVEGAPTNEELVSAGIAPVTPVEEEAKPVEDAPAEVPAESEEEELVA